KATVRPDDEQVETLHLLENAVYRASRKVGRPGEVAGSPFVLSQEGRQHRHPAGHRARSQHELLHGEVALRRARFFSGRRHGHPASVFSYDTWDACPGKWDHGGFRAEGGVLSSRVA